MLSSGCYTRLEQRVHSNQDVDCAGLLSSCPDTLIAHKIHPNLLRVLYLLDQMIKDSLSCKEISATLQAQDSVWFITPGSPRYPRNTIMAFVVSNPDTAPILDLISQCGGKFEASRLYKDTRVTVCFIYPTAVWQFAALSNVTKITCNQKPKPRGMIQEDITNQIH